MTNLFRLVHISDLHFGGEIQPRRSTPGRVAAASLLPPPPVPNGWSTHELAACEDLVVYLKNLRRSLGAPRWGLVISGDLTITGDDSEFSLAQTFFKREIQPSIQAMGVGCGELGFAFDRSVPGNHDHWRGSRAATAGVLASRRPIHGRYVDSHRGADWWSHVEIVGGTRDTFALHLLGLDSFSQNTHNLLARGSIDPASLHAIEAECRQVNQDHHAVPILRVLVLHHSLAPPHGSLAQQLNYAAHQLDSNSEHQLRQTIQRCDIRALLTGHLHHHHLPSAHDPIKEFRAGTAFQWQGRSAPVGQRTGHSVLVHTLSSGSGGVFQWQVAVVERLHGRGFRATQRASYAL